MPTGALGLLGKPRAGSFVVSPGALSPETLVRHIDVDYVSAQRRTEIRMPSRGHRSACQTTVPAGRPAQQRKSPRSGVRNKGRKGAFAHRGRESEKVCVYVCSLQSTGGAGTSTSQLHAALSSTPGSATHVHTHSLSARLSCIESRWVSTSLAFHLPPRPADQEPSWCEPSTPCLVTEPSVYCVSSGLMLPAPPRPWETSAMGAAGRAAASVVAGAALDIASFSSRGRVERYGIDDGRENWYLLSSKVRGRTVMRCSDRAVVFRIGQSWRL